MKKSTNHIIYSWALLLCFVTGQYMVYAHQHNIVKKVHLHTVQDSHNSSHELVKEKCALCDSMHHYAMELLNPGSGQSYVTTTILPVSPIYEFQSLALILSPGRAPPAVS